MRIDKIGLLAACTYGLAVHAAVAQELQAIADPSQRIEIPGVSVLPPQSGNWFLFPVSLQENVSADSLIRLSKKLRDSPPVKPEDSRLVLASVIVRDSRRANSPAPADFLEAFKLEFVKDGKVRVGEMITPRQRLIGFQGALDSSLGATCVRYSRVTEITGQFPAFPNLVGITSTHGLFCSHPFWPRYDINVNFQEIYAKGQQALALETEAESFLKTVVFTRTQPTGEPTGLASNMIALVVFLVISALVPPSVAWLASLPPRTFRSWASHPWLHFWCLPFLPFIVVLPTLLIWREEMPSALVGVGGALWMASTAAMVLSAVHGLGHTYRRSRCKAAFVIVGAVFLGGFLFLLGGPSPFVDEPISDTLGYLLALVFGVATAGWLALMAVAADVTARRMNERAAPHRTSGAV